MIIRKALICLCLGVGLPVFVPDLSSQVLFQIHDTTPDYRNYRTAHACAAAINRLEYINRKKDTIWADSAAFDPNSVHSEVPDTVRNIALQCARLISVDTVAPRDMVFTGKVLLVAGRDQDVEHMFMGRLNSLKEHAEREDSLSDMVNVFTNLNALYRRAKPVRVEALKQLYVSWKEIAVDSIYDYTRITMVGNLYGTGDTVAWRKAANELLSFYAGASDDLKKQIGYLLQNPIGATYWATLLHRILEKEFLDSLMHSSAAYTSALSGMSMRYFGRANPANKPIGFRIPEVQGTFWFSDEDDGRPEGSFSQFSSNQELTSPVSGKVNLLVFLQGGCHSHTPNGIRGVGRRPDQEEGCWPVLSTIRRLKKTYPQVEVTIISRTFGSLGNSFPVNPEKEASLLASYFLGFHGINGIHAISETPFFHLTGADKRRIDTQTANDEEFVVEGILLAEHGNVVLVDQDGRIFHHGSIIREEESFIGRKIRAVLSRGAD